MGPPVPAHPRRLAFLGTPETAVRPLRALVEAGFEVRLVITRPDARRGRGTERSPSPVKRAAAELELPVSHDIDDLLAIADELDLGVVVAFGELIRPRILQVLPMVNLHFSLLPRWRGAAPVERAILAGDDRTGVDLMVVEEGLDTGGVYDRTELSIGPDETAEELRERLVVAGSALLVKNLTEGLGEPEPQRGEPTYAAKISTEDLEIDWGESADAIHRRIRVGGAFTHHNGRRLKIWVTRTSPSGEGILAGVGEGDDEVIEILEVQPEGKGRMSAAAWANGAGWQDGDRFDS